MNPMIIDQISLEDLDAHVRRGRLSFMTVSMETAYEAQINREITRNASVIFAWGMISLALFIIVDYFFAPTIFNTLLMVRMLTAVPVAIASLYLLTNTEFGAKHAENIVCVNIFISALTNIPLVYTASDRFLVFFYAAVAYVVALFYAQGFMTLRFWKTMLILAAGAVVYLPVLPWDIIIKANLDRDSALHLSSLIIIVLTGIISLYRRESLQRYNFVVRKQLDDKYENLQLMTKQLEELADQDPLTCLFNRRAFARVAHEAMAMSVRNNKPFAIILCDVDFFKRYNDTYGHVAGDLVLKQVTEMMSLSMRRTVDVVARFGGEEFIMLLPDTNMVGAETALRALYDRLALMNIEHEDSPLRRVTISSGVYVYTPGDRIDIDDVDEIIRKADTALYKSKQTGRNRITFYDGDDV